MSPKSSLKITLQHDETGRQLEWSLDSAHPIPAGYSIVSNEQGPVFGNWKLNPEWAEATHEFDFTCPECNGIGKVQFSGGVGEEWRDCPTCSKDSDFIQKFSRLAAIGAAWEKNSSIEKWFPLTAEAIHAVIAYARRCEEITDSEMSPKLVYEELESVMGNCKQAKPKTDYTELYYLVELYLCTPNTNPAVQDHYSNLVAWFVRNKRPDGSEPLPVSSEQNESL